MTIRLLAVLCVLTILFSCKKTQENNFVENENTSQDFSEKDLSNLDFIEFTLDPKTQSIIKDWEEYFRLQDVVTEVKKGDLSFFSDNKEEILQLIKSLFESIPDQVNSSATQARLIALETKFYKLESISNLTTTGKQELSNTIKEFLESFSNLNFQMNKKIEKDSRIIEKP